MAVFGGKIMMKVNGGNGLHHHTYLDMRNGKQYCSCEGFHYRKRCSHQRQLIYVLIRMGMI